MVQSTKVLHTGKVLLCNGEEFTETGNERVRNVGSFRKKDPVESNS